MFLVVMFGSETSTDLGKALFQFVNNGLSQLSARIGTRNDTIILITSIAAICMTSTESNNTLEKERCGLVSEEKGNRNAQWLYIYMYVCM